MKDCPGGTWASASTRTCESVCPAGQFKLTDERSECVDVCPSDPDLYGDPDTWECVTDCLGTTANPFADPNDRTCKSSCLPLLQYNNRCIKYCPRGYYANALGNCVLPTACDADTYGDNRTTACTGTCVGRSFADPNSRYCIAVWPDRWYGDGKVFLETCQTPSTTASNITQTCRTSCPNYTYAEDGVCKATCVSLQSNLRHWLCKRCAGDLRGQLPSQSLRGPVRPRLRD